MFDWRNDYRKVKVQNESGNPGSYELVRKDTGEAIARIDRTGTYGRDDYPWGWYLLGEDDHPRRASGSTDTMADAFDKAAERYEAGQRNTPPELASQLAERQGRGVTITYRLGKPVRVETRKGVVIRVERQEENGAWFVDITAPPLPGLSNNVTNRIYLNAIERIG